MEQKVSNNNSFMGYTRSDLTNFLIAMILSFVAIPLVVQTDYWYSVSYTHLTLPTKAKV